MGAQSHLDTERNRYLSRIYDSIFTNTALFSLEVVRNEGFLVYPPVFVVLVPSNREHKGNTCLASTRDLMIDLLLRLVVWGRPGSMRYMTGRVGLAQLILLGPVGSTPRPFHLHSFFLHPPPRSSTIPACSDTSSPQHPELLIQY